GAVAGFQDRDVVAGPGQLVGAGKAGRAGAHHDHAFWRRRRSEGLVREHSLIITRPGASGQASAGLREKKVVPSRPRASLDRVGQKRDPCPTNPRKGASPWTARP